jgi:hypothetical protein
MTERYSEAVAAFPDASAAALMFCIEVPVRQAAADMRVESPPVRAAARRQLDCAAAAAKTC